ncbi:hypothetical protein F4678DRAFT_469508 [Xylaria arbuscula]|nr:hypothetical protein F4678DRAFT_469508 [Xylaria arbuscula]
MNALRDSIDSATDRLDLSWEHQCYKYELDQYCVEPTPPSSLGEPTPTSSHNDGLQDDVGEEGGSDRSNSASTAELARTTEDVISSPTAEPFIREVACAPVKAIVQDNIGQFVQDKPLQATSSSPLLQALDSAYDRMKAFTQQYISMQSHDTLRISKQRSGLKLQQEEQLTASQGLLSNRLDIALRISASSLPQVPSSQRNSRIGKKRSRGARRSLTSTGSNGDVLNIRRGRPSERGFSCSHCAIAKKKDDCCNACSKSPIYRHLCIKADFKESRILLHDLYKTRIRTLLNNIIGYTWRDPDLDPIIIRISNGFDAQLEIELQHYMARDEDALTHRIFRGLEAGMIYPTAKSTSFAIRYGTLTAEKIDEYCEKLACDMILKESLSSGKHRLLHHILLFAVTQINYEDESARIEGLYLVRLALRFWAIQAIFFTYPWRIESGGQSIGMFPLQLPGYWDGITLLPRLVNQELDRAFETRMDEIEKEMLEKLQVSIFKQHRNHWCSIFLSSFILLHSLERDSWNMKAWEYETNGRGAAPWPLKRSPSEYCNQNKHIADIIATHFKIVNQGSSPLQQNWNKPLNQQLLSNSVIARRFILSIQSDFNSPVSSYKAELHEPIHFARSNPLSMNYMYTQMLFGE